MKLTEKTHKTILFIKAGFNTMGEGGKRGIDSKVGTGLRHPSAPLYNTKKNDRNSVINELKENNLITEDENGLYSNTSEGDKYIQESFNSIGGFALIYRSSCNQFGNSYLVLETYEEIANTKTTEFSSSNFKMFFDFGNYEEWNTNRKESNKNEDLQRVNNLFEEFKLMIEKIINDKEAFKLFDNDIEKVCITATSVALKNKEYNDFNYRAMLRKQIKQHIKTLKADE